MGKRVVGVTKNVILPDMKGSDIKDCVMEVFSVKGDA